MRRFFPSLLSGLLLAATLAGCETVTVGGEAHLDKTNQPPYPPRTLAILPSTDSSGDADVAQQFRLSLFNASSGLAFQDIDLRQTDGRISTIAARLGVPPGQLTATELADPSVADLVLASNVESVSRLYLFIYAQLKIKLQVALVDSRTRHILYRNEYTIYDRLGGPTFTVLGLLEPIMVGLMGKRPATLEQTIDNAARQIVGDLPPQRVDRASANKLRLIDVQVGLPALALRAGQAISVKAEASPGARASFTAGRSQTQHPLSETTPGVYEGSYGIQKGDDTPYGIVEVTLAAADGSETLSYAASDSPFSIDTVAPQKATVRRWWPDEGDGAGIFLELSIQPNAPDQPAEAPSKFKVFRRQPDASANSDSGFRLVGETAQTVFHDEQAVVGRTYEYYVVTEDAAGNAAGPGGTTRLTYE